MELTEPIVFIRLAFGLPGQTRQVDNGAAADDLRAARERVKTTARLFSGDAFQAVKTCDYEVKSKLLRLAIPAQSGFSGVYVMPRSLLTQAEAILDAGKARRADLIAAFLSDAYSLEVERARNELGAAFRLEDYPPASIINAAFQMEWRYFTFDVPGNLPDDIRARETAKLQDQINQVAVDCRQALRDGLAELVEHLVERLRPEENGRRKRLSESTVEQLRDFLETIDKRDITSDVAIRDLAAKARAVIGTTSVTAMRDYPSAAARIRDGLAEVGRQIDSLVKTDGGRRIDLSDESEAA